MTFHKYSSLAETEGQGTAAYQALQQHNKISSDLEGLETGYLMYQLTQYGIPLPALDDEILWATGQYGQRVFSTKGFHEMRTALRKEKNERWQYWELRWKVLAAVLTGVTGAIGALIGLVATFKH